MNSSGPPQPPKECVYTQPLNPAHTTRTPAEEELSTHLRDQPPRPPPQHQHHQRWYGEPQSPRTPPTPTIHRTGFSPPSSDAELERLERAHDNRRAHETSDRQEDIDLEYGVELQPSECDIAAAVTGRERRWRSRTESLEVLPKEEVEGQEDNGLGYGRSFPKVYNDLDRKKVAHENLLREWVESEQQGDQGGESTVCERERARRRRIQQDSDVDIKGSITSSSGHGVIAGP